MIRKKTSVASHGVTVTMIAIGVVIQSVIVVILNVMCGNVLCHFLSIIYKTDEPNGL